MAVMAAVALLAQGPGENGPGHEQAALTNESIIKMARVGLDEDIILVVIRSKAAAYLTTPDDLIVLKRAGVSKKVLAALVNSAVENGPDQKRAEITNESVVRMTKAEVDEDLILTLISTRPAAYSTTKDDLIALKRAGVSKKVRAALAKRAAFQKGTDHKTKATSPAKPYPIDFDTPAGVATVTNDSIIKMVKAGLDEQTILAVIRNEPGVYSIERADEIALKDAGVSDTVIAALLHPRGTIPGGVTFRDSQSDTYPYSALREAAEELRSEYEELDARNMAEIDKLMRTHRCQLVRIGPLLDRTIAAMHEWMAAEKKYWDVWGEAEQARVDSQMKTLASIEVDRKRVADLEEVEKEGSQELQRRKAGLEQKQRTEEIAAQIDALNKEIMASEARLADARQQIESLTTQITNTKALISGRLIAVKQRREPVDAYGSYKTALYEKARAAAHAFCVTTGPEEHAPPKGPGSN